MPNMGSASVCVKNVERLISRCEDILGEKVKIKGQEWRVIKYVDALNEKIAELDKSYSSYINTDQLRTFKQRLTILQEVVRDMNERKKQKKNEDQITFVSPQSSTMSRVVVSTSTLITPDQRSLDTPNLKGNSLLRRSVTRSNQAMREELFSRSTEPDELEHTLKEHEERQEKIAEEMIEMARSLKHHSEVARDIIKSDTEVLEKTTKLADENIDSVQRETGRLKERNRGCSCGIWLMLAIVFIVFLQMVVFIRLFPKRR